MIGARIYMPVVAVAGWLALADDTRADSQSGWFVTGQFGRAEYDHLLRGDTPWWGDVNDRGRTAALGFGYEFNRHLALRLMYERSSGIEATNRCPPEAAACPAVLIARPTDTDIWSVVAVPRLPFGNGWAVYGTFGWMRWEIDPHDGWLGTFASGSGTRPIYGGGFEYRLVSGLGLGGELQRAGLDYQAIRAAVSFRF